jgi:diguanylate cyclase (GGDEF)-like protein
VKLTFADELADRPNMEKFLVDAQKNIEENTQENHAIICFHVNKFKYINDLFGYENGNKVLKGIYGVFNSNISSGELCAHRFADQFVLLIKYQQKNDLQEKLNKIGREIHQAIEFYGMHYELVFFMGVYECGKNNSLSVTAMMDRAMIAQKSAEKSCLTSYEFYDDRMRTTQMIEKNMEDRLIPSLEQHQFLVYYQPKYEIGTTALAGCEALVRWQIDSETLVPPNEFIPVFEKSSAIIRLDRYVFEKVCKDIRQWLDTGKHVVPVSVNLSRMHLYYLSFIEEYKQIADSYHVPYTLLELELTESILSENSEKMIVMVKKLHQIGFSLSIDDFGSEYSSLSMLKDIPADTLKLDREFLNDSVNSAKGRIIIENIIRLSKELGMTAVAEGVETKRQLAFLKEVHCELAQGYYFAKPMPLHDYEALLQ